MKFAKFLENLFYRMLLVNASAYPVTASVFIEKVIKQQPCYDVLIFLLDTSFDRIKSRTCLFVNLP